MNPENRVAAFVSLGSKLKEFTQSFYDDENSEFQKVLANALINNPWFTKANQLMALNAIAEMLEETKLHSWIANYPVSGFQITHPKSVGVIMAGNIPAVGFHDLLTVLISGNKIKVKCSSEDKILLPWLVELLCEMNPEFNDLIFFVEQLKEVDAVIATGSNNSSRYFEYYFSKIPHIIRKNRNAITVLSGTETAQELTALGKDIFSYFGLGCRNVSKLYVPKGYDFNLFFRTIESYAEVMQHNKYMNNFDYNQSVYLLNDIKFLTNNFLIVKEDKSIPTPVSVLNYEFYEDISSLKNELNNQKEKIQCSISGLTEINTAVAFGKAQQPALWDYADGVDTLGFLLALK